MPPIHRYEVGKARVPVDLPGAVRWVLDGYEDAYDGTQDDLIGERLAAIRDLRPIWWYSEEFVAVDAHLLSVVRNVLDEETMSGISCEDAADGYGLPTPTKACMWCPWCQAIVLRDRIDFWLDRSGHPGNVYYSTYIKGDPAHDIEPDWALVASGDAYPEEEPCATASRT